MLPTNYRFTLTRDIDSFEVTPYNLKECSFRYPKVEGQAFRRKQFNGNLVFKGTDYDYLKARHDGENYCDVYEILIEQKISGTYQVIYNGYFSMLDGSFDFERCEYTVSPLTNDKYDNLIRNKDKKINILALNPVSIVSYYKTTLEVEVWMVCLAPGDHGLAKYQQMYHIKDISFISSTCIYPYVDSISISFREAIIVPDGYDPNAIDAGGWVAWDQQDELYPYVKIYNKVTPADGFKKWVRSGVNSLPAYTADDIVACTNLAACAAGYDLSQYTFFAKFIYEEAVWHAPSVFHPFYIYFKTTYLNYFDNNPNQVVVYNRCRDLLDSLLYVLKQTCSEFSSSVIISDFFTNVTNPITSEASKVNNLMLCQKSDVLRFNSSNPATGPINAKDKTTTGTLSFQEIVTFIYNEFQVVWFLDDNNDLNLIHTSEITNVGIDITGYSGTAYKRRFEFDKDKLFRYERWSMMESRGIDFVGYPIEYPEKCVSKDDAQKEKDYSSPLITTDLAMMQTHQGDVSDDGFALLATDGSNVLNEQGILSGVLQLNGSLSIANLQNDYWMTGRILISGLMNGIQTTFLSSQKIKKLQEQKIIYCNDDFEPMDLVTTELGNAEVQDAEYKLYDGTLTLSLNV